MTWQLPADLHYTTWTAQRTNAFIRHAGDTPWFCWSSYHDPHPPYAVPEPWASMYDPADMDWLIGEFVPGEFDDMNEPHQLTRDASIDPKPYNADGHGSHGVHLHPDIGRDKLRRIAACYCGMISFMDQQIGTTLDLLESTSQIDKTFIVFTTDHGHFLGQHGLLAKGPYHYEDVIRVPLIAAGPGVPKGETNVVPQTLVDLPATFAALATDAVPLWMQGRPLDPTGGREAVIVENHHNADAVHLRTMVTKTHKLTLWRGRIDWGELFDLHNDPQELVNLYHIDVALRGRLLEQFMQAELDREPSPQSRVSGA
jgi:arylsulfatase A-like enzyme